MFAALTVVRLREAISKVQLRNTKSWISPDEVEPVNLPLAKAVEKVVASMHAVLTKTKEARDAELKAVAGTWEQEADSEKRLQLRQTKAAEVRVVRCLSDLLNPSTEWKVVALEQQP